MTARSETTAVPAAATKQDKAAKAADQAPLPIADQLWAAADKLRGQLEEGEYKHIVLGLIFLKYVSDAFEHRREEVEREVADPEGEFYLIDLADRVEALEDRDAYTSKAVAWIPEEARWEKLRDQAKQPNIGKLIDDAMEAIEKENPSLRGVLPKTFARAEVKPRLLGELIDIFSTNKLKAADGSSEDVLGRVYEYFLNRFGTNEGGQYYTPQGVVRLLVEMLEPYKGRVFDPACGSGGMFVQSMKFVDEHGGRRGELSIFGQEAVAATWRLAKMNLAIRHIEADLGDSAGDSFHEDKHPDLRADFVIANPPFNQSDWGGELLRNDKRWVYGVPPTGNANFAWVQNFLWHLAPSGTAGFILANGALSVQGVEGEIRKKMIEDDVVDCIVSLPTNLFFGTTIPVSLWFLSKGRHGNGTRDRRGEVLFIDARKLGHMATRVHRVLSGSDIERIAATYRAWKSRDADYEHVPGFCRSVSVDEIRTNRNVLSPPRYVGSDAQEAEAIDVASLRQRLSASLDRTAALGDELKVQLAKLGTDVN